MSLFIIFAPPCPGTCLSTWYIYNSFVHSCNTGTIAGVFCARAGLAASRLKACTRNGHSRGQDVKELLEGVRTGTLSHYKYTKLFQYSKNKLLIIKYLGPFTCLFIRAFKIKKTWPYLLQKHPYFELSKGMRNIFVVEK